MKPKKQLKIKPAPDWLPAARANGEGVRQTFLRIIMHEMKCDEIRAIMLFSDAFIARQIVETGVTGLTGSITKYKAI